MNCINRPVINIRHAFSIDGCRAKHAQVVNLCKCKPHEINKNVLKDKRVLFLFPFFISWSAFLIHKIFTPYVHCHVFHCSSLHLMRVWTLKQNDFHYESCYCSVYEWMKYTPNQSISTEKTNSHTVLWWFGWTQFSGSHA